MYLAEKEAQPVADGIILENRVSVKMAFFQIGTSSRLSERAGLLMECRHVLYAGS